MHAQPAMMCVQSQISEELHDHQRGPDGSTGQRAAHSAVVSSHGPRATHGSLLTQLQTLVHHKTQSIQRLRAEVSGVEWPCPVAREGSGAPCDGAKGSTLCGGPATASASQSKPSRLQRALQNEPSANAWVSW